MIRLVLAAALLFPLVGAGCATAQAPADAVAAPGEPLALRLRESVTVGGHTVRFAEVVEDSRCPLGVACVSPGVARIRVEIDGAAFVLTLPGGLPRDGDTDTARVAGLAVTVSELGAAPTTPEAIQATFSVTER